MICPCRQNQHDRLNYEDCCEAIHCGTRTATTAEQLMRSRFSAYALGLGHYICRSWHSSTRPNELSITPSNSWLKLDIVSHSNNNVHFKAWFEEDGKIFVLEEQSNFCFEDAQWFYIDGETKTYEGTLNRNDQCLCGSGKKYKKCCSQ